MKPFAPRLLAWHERHGRHDLPWQRAATPYRVWVSEIMLQQTRASTVIGYFERFVGRFPSAAALAAAPLDDVLALWAGLGYYARARNLHRAANIVVERHGGELPDDFDALAALPGIGRSTAGAILALAHGRRFPILDGNAKRVLVRHSAIERHAGATDVLRELWDLADRLTPAEHVAEYTQAIMDLGATLCTRRRPRCAECPVAGDCRARAAGLEERLPVPRPKRARPSRRAVALLVLSPSGAVLLERRPEAGVWGGLYSLPEADPVGEGDGEAGAERAAGRDGGRDGDAEARRRAERDRECGAERWCRERLGAAARAGGTYAVVEHAFTHFDLELRVELARLERPPERVMDDSRMLWYKPERRANVGMPAPIASLLEQFFDESQTVATL